jgi:hypothetical protein
MIQLSEQAYRVKDSDPAIVGVLLIDGEKYFSRKDGEIEKPHLREQVLMFHSPARLPIFVKFGDLVPWGPPGGDEMPQPKPTCGKNGYWCHGTCSRHGECQYVYLVVPQPEKTK